MLLSSHFKFVDKFHILFAERYSGFLNCTRDLSTNSRDEILRFEITEPTELLIFISLVTLATFPLSKDIYPLYPAPCWGGGRLNAPLRFFEDSENTAARSAAGFSPTLPPIFSTTFGKFRPKAMWGQVTRSGQETQLQNNFPIAPQPQWFRESYETFGIWWSHQCLQNVNLGFFISVTSGQVIFATFPL